MNIDIVLSMLGKSPPESRTLMQGPRLLPLHAMIMSCGWERRENTSYDWHGLKRGKAEFALVQYTLRGRGHLDFEGNTFEILPGDAMLLHFPHNNRYRLPQDSDKWEFVYACLNGRELVRLWREMIDINGPVAKLDENSKALKTLCEIYCASQNGGFETPFDNSLLAYKLSMSLLKELSPQHDSTRAEKPEAINKALKFCKKELSQEIGVDEMAASAGLSRHHFSRIFTSCMGCPPAAYLKNLRLKEAERLLQTSGLSVKEIAESCGFGDSSYFCRVFRESFGISPENYRKSGIN